MLSLEKGVEAAQGISAEIPDDIHVAIWSQFLFICAMSGVGAVVCLGEIAGVATPIHAALHASLLPQELRARGELDF